MAENWIKWDLDSRAGYKMAVYFEKFGAQGYGVFMVLIEMLYREENHQLPLSQIDIIADLTKCDSTLIGCYIGCLCHLGLLQKDDVHFWSPRVYLEIEDRLKFQSDLQQRASRAGKLGAERRWGKPKGKPEQALNQPDGTLWHPMALDGTPMGGNGENSQKRLEEIRLEEIRLDKKTNTEVAIAPPVGVQRKYRIFNIEDFKIPFGWDIKAKTALQDWIEYKAKAGHPKMQDSYQKEILLYDTRPALYVELVERAISEGWQGLNPGVELNTGQNGAKKKTSFEKNMEVLRHFEEQEALERNGN